MAYDFVSLRPNNGMQALKNFDIALIALDDVYFDERIHAFEIELEQQLLNRLVGGSCSGRDVEQGGRQCRAVSKVFPMRFVELC